MAKFSSIRKFAAFLAVPDSTLANWLKHDRWRWARKSPWSGDIKADVLRWAADELDSPKRSREPVANLEVASTVQLRDEKLRQEIRKLRAHADQAEAELAKTRGGLHDADACEVEAVRRAAMFRDGVQNLAPQVVSLALARGMQHEDAPAFQGQIEQLINGCLRYLSTAADVRSATDDAEGVPGAVSA